MNRCGTCNHRDSDGHCTNEHIHEDDYDKRSVDKDKCLIYSYYEGGSFWVGKNFGCVHHSNEKEDQGGTG